MEYETVIGLEVHSQLLTNSKMFCPCRSDYQSSDPNVLVCPVCMGMPGALPVINQQAVEHTIKMGLALGCTISLQTKFDRKNYAYPDLMKGYQISQYDIPIANNGCLEIDVGDATKKIRIERVHLEEDVAKLQHVKDGNNGYSLLDINRSGVPLMEIVSHPDMRSPEEAREYLTNVRTIIQYLKVSTGNMEEGSFRCDANISIRPIGSSDMGNKVEIKNMNSFSGVYNALNHEVSRQKELVDGGGVVGQETRGWIDEKGITISQRSKENSHDYRYFPDPDLPPLLINQEHIDDVKNSLPELPRQRRIRFMNQYGLPLYDAQLLTDHKATADFLEEAMNNTVDQDTSNPMVRAKSMSNWVLGTLAGLLNAKGLTIEESPVSPDNLSDLVDLIESGELSNSLAKVVLQECCDTGESPSRIVAEKGYTQITDESVVEDAVMKAISENPSAVLDYVSGKVSAIKFLMGQVMKLTRGEANPGMVDNLLKCKLKEIKEG